MIFRIIYEIDVDTMQYRIKFKAEGLSDEESYAECLRALATLEAHLLYGKPAAASVH